MMPHIIPGGRQRASSDGDVLEDENDTINASGVLDRLTEAHRNVSRSAILTTDDDRDSDDHKSITDADKSKKKGLRSKISFKSVRKAVSRAFPKDSRFGSNSSLNKEEVTVGVRMSSAAGLWTPTLKRRNPNNEIEKTDGHHSYRSNREENTGIDSVSRPLITDPGKMIAKWERIPGNVGLFNHGNTCFMNAVLQCLSHTDSFTEYFTTDLYKDDLRNSRNSSKKLGSKTSKGDVTEQLGVLLKSLWSDRYNSEISIDFKAVVGKYNNQYKGSSQHDAQEFLLWLLDRVHEDLILPLSKKKKHPKSLAGFIRPQTDEELADAAESALTTSFVSQLFQGLHRSSLSCPHCGHLSNTFDPYLCVSLPLPHKCLRPIYVIVVALGEPQQSVKIGLSLSMYDTIRELREAVSAETKIPVDQILLCDISRDGFYAPFSNEQPLSDIPESCDVYAIEMFASDQASEQSTAYQTQNIQIVLLHVEKGCQSTQRFGQPGVIMVSREADMKQLQFDILRHLGSAVKQEIFQQHLRPLFQLQIVDGSSQNTYLSPDVEMPLYTQTVDRVLSMFDEEFGPQHLKLIVEWTPEIKAVVITEVEDHVIEHASVNKLRSVAQQAVTVSLGECFQLYTQEEKLAGEDAWLCPHCKKPQKGATKTLGLWSLPDILILHLKRFKQTGLRRNKLNTLVEFPVENLDMKSPVVHSRDLTKHHDNMCYDLIGVANHYGNMNGGHYTAFCKNTLDGTWQEFDDRHVRPISENQVVSKSAYILIYQRRSLSKLVNQRMHTGAHWVFTMRQYLGDKSSPQRQRGSEGSPVKRGGIQEDLEQVASTHFDRRVFSKEWNGQSSPTRKPTSRPLTPQPQRRQTNLELGTYDQSSVTLRRTSFRTSRPTLSRQVSDAALRAKKHMYQDSEASERLSETREQRDDHRHGSRLSGSQLQPQILQVQLPPKSSVNHDLRGSDATRAPNSDILQPQQVHLPSQPQRDSRLSSVHQRTVSVSRGDQDREVLQSSKTSISVTDQPRPHSSSTVPSQKDSFSSPARRPWEYESKSSQSSYDTQSSHDSQRSQSSPRELELIKSSFSNNNNSDSNGFYDWRQPEARVGKSLAVPATAVTSVVINKPPLPPKILTRSLDASRSDSVSASSPLHKQDEYHVTVTTPSLTSPPSPAPKDSVRDIQRRAQQEPYLVHPESRQIQEPCLIHQETSHSRQEIRLGRQEPRLVRQEASIERPSHMERFIALSDNQQWDHVVSVDGVPPGDRHILREGEFEQRRTKVASQISVGAGEQGMRGRKSQPIANVKFATIALGNRDARSELHEIKTSPMVPRSSTDNSIYTNNYGQSSPSHAVHHSLRYSAGGYQSIIDRGMMSSSTVSGYPKPQWDRGVRGQDSFASVPLYARDDRDSQQNSLHKGIHSQIYRGPMFQLTRPKKSTGDISAPSLRESSV